MTPVDQFDHIEPISYDEAVKAVGSDRSLKGHLVTTFGAGFVQMQDEIELREIRGQYALCAKGRRARTRVSRLRRRIPQGHRAVRHYRQIRIPA